MEDPESFERDFFQLKTYYTDARTRWLYSNFLRGANQARTEQKHVVWRCRRWIGSRYNLPLGGQGSPPMKILLISFIECTRKMACQRMRSPLLLIHSPIKHWVSVELLDLAHMIFLHLRFETLLRSTRRGIQFNNS